MCVGGDVKHCTIQSLLRMMAIVNSVNPLTPTVSYGYSLNDGLTWSGTGCFIAVPIGNSGCQRVNVMWCGEHTWDGLFGALVLRVNVVLVDVSVLALRVRWHTQLSWAELRCVCRQQSCLNICSMHQQAMQLLIKWWGRDVKTQLINWWNVLFVWRLYACLCASVEQSSCMISAMFSMFYVFKCFFWSHPSPVRARELCRVNPPRFLAECHMRRLNQVVLFCCILHCLLFGLCLVFVVSLFLICLLSRIFQSEPAWMAPYNCAAMPLRIYSLTHLVST